MSMESGQIQIQIQSESRAFSLLATGLLASTSPSRVATHVQCDDFPKLSPMTILAFSVVPWWYPPIGGSIGGPSCGTCITWPWPPGPAVSYQSFGAASVLGGNTPPGPRGAGADGHPGTPDRRPLGAWPNCRPCAECSPPKFIDGLSQTVMGISEAMRFEHPAREGCLAG